MKLLLIGDGNHQFILNYVIWLKRKKGPNLQIDILSFSPVALRNTDIYDNIYQLNNSLCFRLFSNIKGIRRYYRFWKYKRIFKHLPPYDCVHFHFINVDSFFLVNLFRQLTKSRIILSIWGSDLYKVKTKNEKGLLESCKKADFITFANKKSVAYFRSKYKWNKDNLKICRFGLAPLENLKAISLSKIECKEKLKWNNQKIAFTIGYNLSPAQQHLEILEQFQDEKLIAFRDKILLIIPITYGGTEEYKIQIINKLKDLPFEFEVYDEFLNDEKVALIRQGSDVMIQLQKTDQFSGSMQEHLYTNNIVITGSWLPYDTLKEQGAWFLEIDEIIDLKEVIPDVIENFSSYKKLTISSPEAITKLSSWDKNIDKWIGLYTCNR